MTSKASRKKVWSFPFQKIRYCYENSNRTNKERNLVGRSKYQPFAAFELTTGLEGGGSGSGVLGGSGSGFEGGVGGSGGLGTGSEKGLGGLGAGSGVGPGLGVVAEKFS